MNQLKFVEGKEYLTDGGDIATCRRIYSDNSMMFDINGEDIPFNKYGVTFYPRKQSTLVSEYAEPEKITGFDWTKPAQTKNGKKVLGLTLLKGITLENNLIGQIEGETSVTYWNSLGFNRNFSDGYQLENIPEKTVVPLEPQDIKPGYLIKRASESSEPTWELITGVIKCKHDKGGYYITTGTGKTLKTGDNLYNFVISKDNGSTWEKCEKTITK